MSEASEAKAKEWVDEVIYDADKLEILDARKCAEGDKSGSYWSTIIGFNLRDIEGAMSLAEVNTGEDEATDKALCEAIVEGLKLRARHAAHLARCARMEEALKRVPELTQAYAKAHALYQTMQMYAERDHFEKEEIARKQFAENGDLIDAIEAQIAAALSSAPVAREGECK